MSTKAREKAAADLKKFKKTSATKPTSKTKLLLPWLIVMLVMLIVLIVVSSKTIAPVVIQKINAKGINSSTNNFIRTVSSDTTGVESTDFTELPPTIQENYTGNQWRSVRKKYPINYYDVKHQIGNQAVTLIANSGTTEAIYIDGIDYPYYKTAFGIKVEGVTLTDEQIKNMRRGLTSNFDGKPADYITDIAVPKTKAYNLAYDTVSSCTGATNFTLVVVN